MSSSVCCVLEKTRIVNPLPRETVAVAGSDVTLPCGVATDPYHSVQWTWYHNATLIVVPQLSLTQDGSLQLSSVTKQEAGEYTCDIESTGGQDSSSGQLHVIGK